MSFKETHFEARVIDDPTTPTESSWEILQDEEGNDVTADTYKKCLARTKDVLKASAEEWAGDRQSPKQIVIAKLTIGYIYPDFK